MTTDATQKNATAEKTIHDQLMRLAQDAWDQHGICIQDITFSWIGTTSVTREFMQVTQVEARMMSKRMR